MILYEIDVLKYHLDYNYIRNEFIIINSFLNLNINMLN